MEREEVEVGKVTTVEFLANARGGKPICRVGRIVEFIDNACDKFVAPRSLWIVEVSAINDKSAVVMPIVKVKTAWENLRDINRKIETFLKTDKPERKRKPKVKYTNV